jgi:hypothetical protein
MARMMAAVFAEPGRIVLDSRPVPDVGPSDALLAGTVSIGFFSFAAFSFLARWLDSSSASLILGGAYLVAALVLALIVQSADRRSSAC